MERYIEIIDGKYYDCISNKFVFSKKKMKGSVPNNLYNFRPLFNYEFLSNNLKISRQQLILSVTEQCNFRCEYCVYHDMKYQENVKLRTMNFITAKKAIDEFITNSTFSERRCISFYGGEPLLNFELIQECVEYVESLNLIGQLSFLITTNGELISKSIAEYLYKHKFLVNISLDGSQKIHDRYRKSFYGKDSFNNVITGAKYLIDIDPDYWKDSLSFLCVLAPPVDIASVTDFFELLPYNYTLSDLGMTNHMRNIIEKNVNYDNVDTQPQEIYVGNKKRANRGLITEMRTTREILQRPFFSPFTPGRYCIPGLKRTFVSVDGNYCICEKDDQNENHVIGDVNNGINYERLDKICSEVLDFHKQHCKTCWAARFCGMCFATLDKFPDCCEEFKRNTLQSMRGILEGDYE